MDKETKKRQRSQNWLEEDKIILKEMVKERVSILENKNTDSNTNAKKVAAWQDLLTSFNAMAKTPRTMHQLKSQWCIMKMQAKKQKFVERKEILRTGGGPPPPTEPPNGDDIAVWLPYEFAVDHNEFDSDSQPLQNMDILVQENTEEQYDTIADVSGPNTEETMLEPSTSHNAEETMPEPSTFYTETITEYTKTDRTKKGTAKKKTTKSVGQASHAQKICENEIACRLDLHQAQMACEQQKMKNLKLEEELLKYKILYYKNKTE